MLDVIADRGPVSVAAIADELGLHPNSVRDHLDHLLDSGHLRRVRAEVQGRGRPAWLYELAAAAQPGGSSAVVAALAAHLQATFPDPARQGRAAGECAAPRVLVAHWEPLPHVLWDEVLAFPLLPEADSAPQAVPVDLHRQQNLLFDENP